MKIKTLFLIICMTLTLSSAFASVEWKGIAYSLSSDKTAEVVAATTKYSGSISIPSVIYYNSEAYRVTSIGRFAFYACTDLTGISLPSTLKTIGNGAFEGCSGLSFIYLPDSIRSIGDAAFWGCSGLTSITIPQSVTSIGYGAFRGCSRLVSIAIPASVRTIGQAAFSQCNSLSSMQVDAANPIYDSREGCNAIIETRTNTLLSGCQTTTIPNSVRAIGSEAFDDCSGLSAITLPQQLTRIGQKAFWGCSGLTSITIPDGVTEIADWTFAFCTNLTTVVIPNTVKTIGYGAFRECEKLNDIMLPNAISFIASDAFLDCTGITSFTLPSSVRHIGNFTFDGCRNLSAVTIPRSTIAMSSKAFASCPVRQLNFSMDDQVNMADLHEVNILSFLSKEIGEDRRTATPLLNQTFNPANLVILDNTITFADVTGNSAIDASETCYLNFMVENRGKGVGKGCIAKVETSGTNSDISIADVALGDIAAGEQRKVRIPIKAGINAQDGNVNLKVEVTEQMGFGTNAYETVIATKSFVAPQLQIVDYSITSVGSAQLQKKVPFDLQVMLQNTQYGWAENVDVEIKLPDGVYLISGDAVMSYKRLAPGDAESLVYSVVVSNNYANADVPIQFHLKEKHGKYAEDRTINLAINQVMASSKLVINEQQSTPSDIQIKQIGSAVDKNIPEADCKNKNTFVLIIANEQYKQVASVPYALNDGNIFQQYCIRTLGIPQKNIQYLPNATLNDIRMGINKLENITSAFRDEAPKVIVYYAGHGVPDESSKTAYLLPVDGSGTDYSTGYKLEDLYAALSHLPAERIMVFLDACFSGSVRGNEMIVSARGIALKVKSGEPRGNMVVFSAAQGDESAYPNNEEQHGLFTYFLLKKLQETAGDVTLEELGEYIIRHVRQQSAYENGKPQTPSVSASSQIGDTWKNWKLK